MGPLWEAALKQPGGFTLSLHTQNHMNMALCVLSFGDLVSATVLLVGLFEDLGHFKCEVDFELEMGFAFLLKEIVKAAKDVAGRV